MTTFSNQKLCRLIDEENLVDKIFGYAYKKCFSMEEAENLSQEILLALYESAAKAPQVSEVYGYIWKIAYYTYVGYVRHRSHEKQRVETSEDIETASRRADMENCSCENVLSRYIDHEEVRMILHRMAYLGRSYREAMVLYYLNGLKTEEIARSMNISVNLVKQRLFTARETIRREVTDMTYSFKQEELKVKPKQIEFLGNGNPVKSCPISKAERILSKSILYFCREKARSMKEISEAIGVPMCFVEEEVAIQCQGSNGHDGLLAEIGKGRYIATFPMMDYPEIKAAGEELAEILGNLTGEFKKLLADKREELLGKVLNQVDYRLLKWKLAKEYCDVLSEKLRGLTRKKYYNNVEREYKDYYVFGIVSDAVTPQTIDVYGIDSTVGEKIAGYKKVWAFNMKGPHIPAKFYCGENISTNSGLLFAVQAINGLKPEDICEDEKEAAAAAVAQGFLKREDGILKTAVPVYSNYEIENNFDLIMEALDGVDCDSVVSRLGALTGRYLPKHLIGQADSFIGNLLKEFPYVFIEKCLSLGILEEPVFNEAGKCVEGTWLIIEKD